jgi:hypothetical protein
MDQRGDRRRAFHGVGQPDVERNLSRLPRRADKQQQRDQRHRAKGRFRADAGGGAGDLLEIERGEALEDGEHAEDESEVANPIDDERFLAGVGCRLLAIPEANQQIRAESDAFPPDEHHEEVRAQNEHEHERREQVQVREVARVLGARLLVHVGGRVDVDQRADAGHDENHDRGQRIERERETDAEVAGGDPVVDLVDDRRSVLAGGDDPPRRGNRREERADHRRAGNPARHTLAEPPAEAGVDQKAGERQQRDQDQHAATTSAR